MVWMAALRLWHGVDQVVKHSTPSCCRISARSCCAIHSLTGAGVAISSDHDLARLCPLARKFRVHDSGVGAPVIRDASLLRKLISELDQS